MFFLIIINSLHSMVGPFISHLLNCKVCWCIKITFFFVVCWLLACRLVTVIDYFLRYGYGYHIRLSVWYRGLRLFSYPCKYRKYRTFCKVTVFYGYFGIFLPTVMYGYVRLCTVTAVITVNNRTISLRLCTVMYDYVRLPRLSRL